MLGIILSIFVFNLNLELVQVEKVQEEPFLYSAGGQFLYQIEYGREAIGEIPVKRFSLYDRKGDLLWSKEFPEEEAFFVSDLGWVVGVFGSHPKARLTFYDGKGKIKKRLEIEYPYGYSFSQTGNFFYANTARGILAFNREGKVIRNFGFGGPFFPSPDDKFFAVRREDSLFLFKEGKNFGKFPLASLMFRDLAFSSDNKLLAVAEKHHISLFSLEKDIQLLWRKEFDRATSLWQVAVDDKGTVYLGGETERREGFLSVLKEGEERERVKISYLAPYETILEIFLSPNSVSVRTTEQRFHFSVSGD
ncbi:MAG: hypothetical protein ABIK97_01650 [candidate division WOR-3 bacterium]